MSLATRCTACGTIFRVVQDQLKVSEGWVRCGRCQEVFNALEGLFDLEREPPPQRPAPRAPVEPEAPALVRPSAPDDWDSTQSQRSADPVEDEPELPATNESDVLDSRFLRRELGLRAGPPEDDRQRGDHRSAGLRDREPARRQRRLHREARLEVRQHDRPGQHGRRCSGRVATDCLEQRPPAELRDTLQQPALARSGFRS